MSEVKVNKISPRTNCGTTTLGDSGDSFVIPSGVTITNNGTQTGFGREGSVNWQTGSIKTSTFTAANGEGYFVDTSSGAVTANLPAGSAGAIVAFADYTRTFASNNLTINPNGSEKIGGIAEDAKLTINGQSATFVYVDGTEGWVNVQETQTSQTGASPFIIATGGTITTSGDYKIHTFTGPGTFTVCQAAGTCGPTRNNVSYLVAAGGGGGGGVCGAGGGGAGGFREYRAPLSGCYSVSPLNGNPGGTAITVTAQAYPITVGSGGLGGQSVTNSCDGAQGSNSVFSTIISTGGGGGGAFQRNGTTGGSGGGGGGRGSIPGSAGNTPPVSPPQGQPGGGSTPNPSNPDRGGGGGGATAAGTTAPGSLGGPGGAGATTSISGSPVARAGGGGGGNDGSPTRSSGADGGGDGGGQYADGLAGTTNTGGGGGGAGGNTSKGGNGGSGIVIIRYKYQ
jgi:hypothetical protein